MRSRRSRFPVLGSEFVFRFGSEFVFPFGSGFVFGVPFMFSGSCSVRVGVCLSYF